LLPATFATRFLGSCATARTVVARAVVCADREKLECSDVADCDEALGLLRRLAREGSVAERDLARLAIDDVLDRRNELLAERAVAE
jgi:hypothetical protein